MILVSCAIMIYHVYTPHRWFDQLDPEFCLHAKSIVSTNGPYLQQQIFDHIEKRPSYCILLKMILLQAGVFLIGLAHVCCWLNLRLLLNC